MEGEHSNSALGGWITIYRIRSGWGLGSNAEERIGGGWGQGGRTRQFIHDPVHTGEGAIGTVPELTMCQTYTWCTSRETNPGLNDGTNNNVTDNVNISNNVSRSNISTMSHISMALQVQSYIDMLLASHLYSTVNIMLVCNSI